jgi:hypothetical protein
MLRNKFILIVFSLFILLALVFAVYSAKIGCKIIDLASLVPESTVVFVKVNDLSKNYSELEKALFFQKFSKSEIWDKIKASPKINSVLPLITQAKELLGKEYVFSVVKNKKSEYKILQITRLNSKQRIQEAVVTLLLKGNDKVRLSSSNFSGVKINALAEDNTRIYYSVVGDCLVVSDDEDLLKQSIVLARARKSASILYSDAFNKATSVIKNKNILLWGWADYESLQDVKNNALLNSPAQNILKENNNFLDPEYPFSDICWQIDIDKDINISSISIIDQNKLSMNTVGVRLIKSFMQKSLRAKTIDFIGKDPTLMVNFNFNDASNLIDYLEKVPVSQGGKGKAGEPAKNFSDELNARLGVNIKNELAPYLGQELSISLVDFSQGLIMGSPMSDVLFVIEAKDTEKLKAAVIGVYNKKISQKNDYLNQEIKKDKSVSLEGSSDKSASLKDNPQPKEVNVGLVLNSRNFMGTKIFYVGSSSDGEAGSVYDKQIKGLVKFPRFAFVDNFLLLSESQEKIMNAIELYNTKKLTFRDNTELVNSNIDLSKITSFFYFDIKGLVDKIANALGPLAVNQKVIEILDAVGSIESISGTVEYGSDVSVVKTKIKLLY